MRERTIASHYARAALGRSASGRLRLFGPAATVGHHPEQLTEPRARVAPKRSRLLQMLWLALDDEYLGFADGPSKRGTSP